MTDNDLPLADGFVRAVMEDNARLRAENEALRQAAADARAAAARELRTWQGRVWRLVDAAGGDVTLPLPAWKAARRLLIEGAGDLANDSIRLRFIADSDVTPAGYADEVVVSAVGLNA